MGISPLDDDSLEAPAKPPTTSSRSKKRDPSFSGVADLFGDDSEEPPSEEDYQMQDKDPEPEKLASSFASSAKIEPPSEAVESLKEELKECQESKRRLATALSQELERLRAVIRQFALAAAAA